MLRHYRRLWVVLVAALLGAPLAMTFLAPEGDWMSADEMRPRATTPGVPHSLSDWGKLSGKLDGYLGDHFGFRRAMIHAHAILTRLVLRSGSALVQIGIDGWLFYQGDDTLRQNAGLLMREPWVLDSAETMRQSAGLLIREQRVLESAETINSIRTALARLGIRFIVASPPNSATIYPEQLPQWARNLGRWSEYDLMLDALASRGIKAIDLRPPLRAAKASGAVYLKHDTHWSALGAVVGFNTVADAAGHSGWQLDPAVVLAPATQRNGGDLARMLGIAQDVSEQSQTLTLTDDSVKLLAGPAILVLGDSFTETLFEPMVVANGRRFAWAHHALCGFDWTLIEQVHLDEVWWMPTERDFLCNAGVRPKSMPSMPGKTNPR
jgi:alginate O-acetyltransferase complex protein AlgJ